MPAPATSAEFIDLVRKSTVVEEKRLDAALERLRAAGTLPNEPGKLAGLLIAEGLLTQFQAQQIVQGKWKRFTIGKYKVLENLGSGGMGSVYLCEHMLMRRRVAVKVLPTAKAEDPAALERFYREARAVAALDHPNIVRAYDIDQSEKLHFLVMEYVDGASLQEIVRGSAKSSGADDSKAGKGSPIMPLDPIRAAHYIRQAALGLQHAHEQASIVHRDIKPGNILVDRNGIVKVLDMGLARFFNDKDDNLTEKYDETTLGTADYLAPEQALDSHSVDIRADIYSLGATFYFCLTGRTPFQEGTVAQKLIWHQTRQPKPINTLRGDVDAGLIAIVDRMMAKDPNQRYQTPLEVAEALAPWTRSSIPPPPETEMPQLSPAARGGAPSMSDLGSASGSGTRISPSGTPAPRTNWQVTAPPNVPSPSTHRSATPPVARATPPNPPSVPAVPPRPAPPPPPPPAPAPVQTVPPAAPIATVPRPPTPSLLQASPVIPRPAPPVAAPETPPWGQTERAGDSPETEISSRRRLRQSAEAARSRRLLYGVIGLVVLIAVGVAAFFIWRAVTDVEPIKPDGGPKVRGPMTWYVGPEEEFRKISSVLPRFRRGDTIVFRGERLEDMLAVDSHTARNLKGLRIIADEKNPRPVWRPIAQPNRDSLIQIEDVEDFYLKGFDFDGENKVKNIVNLLCNCRNVVLEDVAFKNYKDTALRFTNCSAPEKAGEAKAVESGTRVEVNRATFISPNKPPLILEVLKEFPLNRRNERITVNDDCTFNTFKEVHVIIDLPGGENKDVKLPKQLTLRPMPRPVAPPPPPPK